MELNKTILLEDVRCFAEFDNECARIKDMLEPALLYLKLTKEPKGQEYYYAAPIELRLRFNQNTRPYQ